jgi:glycerol-1-phosphate dehydrogenase [NAD(P)+]
MTSLRQKTHDDHAAPNDLRPRGVGNSAPLGSGPVSMLARTPSTLAICKSERETIRRVIEALRELRAGRPLFVFGRQGRVLLGRSLFIDCSASFACRSVVAEGAVLTEARHIQDVLRASRSDSVVACGGGQTLDVGKYVASHGGVPFVSVPTQASHDGMSSPVAVMRQSDDDADSYGVSPPAALIVPLYLIARAPRVTIVSGAADLVANVLAIADWEWARDLHGEAFDDYAALLGRAAAQQILAGREVFVPGRPFTYEEIDQLVTGLILSGLAMTRAGSSRPCSGPEHLISHAFDALTLGHGTHGEQVAVGAFLAAQLYPEREDLLPVLDLLTRIGAPSRPSELGISRDEAVQAVRLSASVRPNRRSRLTTALTADPEFVDECMDRAWFSSE